MRYFLNYHSYFLIYSTLSYQRKYCIPVYQLWSILSCKHFTRQCKDQSETIPTWVSNHHIYPLPRRLFHSFFHNNSQCVIIIVISIWIIGFIIKLKTLIFNSQCVNTHWQLAPLKADWLRLRNFNYHCHLLTFSS